MRRLLLTLLLLLPSAGFAADLNAAQLFTAGKVVDRTSVIVATAKAHDADMCRGFSLTESQVKDFFRKAKALKPTTPQIVDQIKQIEKYISRMPG